jgi:hypothetical protein
MNKIQIGLAGDDFGGIIASQLLAKSDRKGKHGPRLRTKEQFQRDLDARNVPYLILEEYQGLQIAINFQCKNCGDIINSWPQCVLAGDSHCSCSVKRIYRHDLQSYNKIIVAYKPDFKAMIFTGTNKAINTYLHKVCGRTFQQSEASFRLSKHCPLCAGQFAENINTIAQIEAQTRLDVKFPDEYKITGNYSKASELCEVTHKCSHKINIAVLELLRWKNSICEKCNPKKIGRIHTVTIQGWEYKVQCQNEVKVLSELIRQYGINNVYGNIPKWLRVFYNFNGRRNISYYPDFYIANSNTVVEVKDITTMGLTKNGFLRVEDHYQRNCAKAKATVKAGYNFMLILFDKSGNELVVPDNWFSLSRKQLIQQLKLS